MRPLTTKPCRICGQPVTRSPRKTRKAFYYPRQCQACYKKDRDHAGRIAKLKATFATKGHPSEKPLGSRRLHLSSEGYLYWVVKVRLTGKWPYEHRWLMAQHLGRPLLTTEHVHHRNHDTLDNHLDNLTILNHGEHTRQHHVLPDGQWSLLHIACIQCHSTTSRHASKGLCTACYQRNYRQNHLEEARARDRARWPARAKNHKRGKIVPSLCNLC